MQKAISTKEMVGFEAPGLCELGASHGLSSSERSQAI